MGSFTAYFDASGHPDGTRTLSVAGFVATIEHWTRVEKKWNRVLAKYQISELHMKDFAHSTGQYQKWKGIEEIRREFLGDLIDVLLPMMRYSVVCSVDLVEYRRCEALMKEHKLRKFRSPLALAGCKCIAQVKRWADHKGIPQENIVYVFEDGDADKANLRLCSKMDYGLEPFFEPKKSSTAFQAADLLAFEHLQFTGKAFADPARQFDTEELRKPLQRLMRIPHTIAGEDSWIVLESPNIEIGFRRSIEYLNQSSTSEP